METKCLKKCACQTIEFDKSKTIGEILYDERIVTVLFCHKIIGSNRNVMTWFYKYHIYFNTIMNIVEIRTRTF